MTTSSFRNNTASSKVIKSHLLGCDFNPPLEEYVENIDRYIEKIINNAERFELWDDEKLIGFLACYANNLKTKEAFITMISVLPEARGRGIATKLLGNAREHCKNEGFKALYLEVRVDNMGALRLYHRLGYLEQKREDKVAVMKLELSNWAGKI